MTLSFDRRLLAALLLASLMLEGCGERSPDPKPPNVQLEGWTIEHSHRYALTMASSSTLGSADAKTGFSFELAAQLDVTPLSVAADSAELALVFHDVVVTGALDDESRARFARVARELGTTTVVHYSRGAMTEILLGKDLEALTVGIVRNVASALQTPRHDHAAAEQVTEEYDATGRYVASYTRGGTSHVYEKRKLNYEALIADRALQASLLERDVPPPTIASSSGRLELTSGRLRVFESRERLELALVAQGVLATDTTLSLREQSEGPARAIDRVALESTGTRLAAAKPYVTATARFDFNAIKIGGRGFDELLSMLESLAARRAELNPTDPRPVGGLEPERADEIKRWTGEQNRTLTAMSTLLRAEPELTARAIAAVRARSPAHRELISALGFAGTDSAQQALLAIMRDATHSEDDRNTAGLALIRTKAPTDASVHALEGLLDDPHWHQYAILGLGTFARLAGEAGRSAEHERLGRLLLARLQASKGSSSRRDALSALSNSGYAGMVGAIAPYLEATEVATREPAVRALRLVKHPDVEKIALGKLADPAASVRTTALEVAENLGPSEKLGAAVQARALDDADANVRLQALQLLIAWKERLPNVRSTIERMAKLDPSESIRRTASNAVASPG